MKILRFLLEVVKAYLAVCFLFPALLFAIPVISWYVVEEDHNGEPGSWRKALASSGFGTPV